MNRVFAHAKVVVSYQTSVRCEEGEELVKRVIRNMPGNADSGLPLYRRRFFLAEAELS